MARPIFAKPSTDKTAGRPYPAGEAGPLRVFALALNSLGIVPMGGKSMRSRNYTKEIGLDTDEPRVPTMASAAVFVLLVVLALLFARQVNALQHTAAEPTHTPAAVKVSSR